MNPQRIYEQHRDDTLAKRITAERYKTFVAMPFGERFSYRQKEVYEKVIQAAATKANDRKLAKREFDLPKRTDDIGLAAAVITEEIVVQILESHFFIADLTNENPGVLLETGIALGLKANTEIILISQDSSSDLHFDLRNNNVISYNPPNEVERIADAFISCADSFETQSNSYVREVAASLTPDAIVCLKWYGEHRRTNAGQSLFAGVAQAVFSNLNPPPTEGNFEIRFVSATRELLRKRLLSTEYKVAAVAAGDTFGMHATPLGWAFMKHMWGYEPVSG